ncbi:response regulator [Novosphingobium profundi]|uniref:response regulator transcription factor n=1 Tax=Novosphingobium profundi TaxID=1774954 RepID=UPI001BD9BC61|nr:response regulator [Novosphingobium profundi]MBT0669199.1 response regulator [Novosphingobium profundi]
MTKDLQGAEAHVPIAVLDDDADLAASVARMLARCGHRARAFTQPADLLAALEGADFECVVSDVQLGAMDGFALAEAVRGRDPDIALVFMTAWPTTSHAVDAVRRHGGVDYLEKPLDEERLVAAVGEGRAWAQRARQRGAALAMFTRREREVLDLLVLGHSNKEVAEILAISARTVEDHRAAIMGKSGARGLAQLVALARGEGA